MHKPESVTNLLKCPEHDLFHNGRTGGMRIDNTPYNAALKSLNAIQTIIWAGAGKRVPIA